MDKPRLKSGPPTPAADPRPPDPDQPRNSYPENEARKFLLESRIPPIRNEIATIRPRTWAGRGRAPRWRVGARVVILGRQPTGPALEPAEGFFCPKGRTTRALPNARSHSPNVGGVRPCR